MWITKKKFKGLEKRIADLEGQVQSQQKVIDQLHVDTSKSPKQDLGEAFRCATNALRKFSIEVGGIPLN